MDIFKESLLRIKDSSYRERLLDFSKERESVFSYLGFDAEGVLLSKFTSASLILHRGVEEVIHPMDSSMLYNKVSGKDMSLSIFDQQYLVRNRGDVSLFVKDLSSIGYFGDFEKKFTKFLTSSSSGSGISLVGSPSHILNAALLDYIEKRIEGTVCRLIKLNGIFKVLEYRDNGSVCALNAGFESLYDAISYIESSPYKNVFIESFSGFSAIEEALNLSIQGKSVIYCESGVGATFSIYKAQTTLDKNVFGSMFLGSLFINVLPCVQGKILPKNLFSSHSSYSKWSSLKSSPNPNEYILRDPISGIESVSVGPILLSEVIESSKPMKKWITENVSPSDMAANLRLDQGWLSISDEASKAAREGLVTFDQIQNKITLI